MNEYDQYSVKKTIIGVLVKSDVDFLRDIDNLNVGIESLIMDAYTIAGMMRKDI